MKVEWPAAAGRVVQSEMTVDGFGDYRMRTVIEDAPFHQPGGEQLIFDTWEDDEAVISMSTVEMPLCGDSTGRTAVDSLGPMEMFEEATSVLVDQYLGHEWERLLAAENGR